MTRQTPSSLLLIAALAGGIGFVAFVALMVMGEFTFSPALFLAGLVALAVAVFLFQGFHDPSPTDRPELQALDRTKLGDVTREAGTAGVTPGSAGVTPGAASGYATAASTAPGAARAATVDRDEEPGATGRVASDDADDAGAENAAETSRGEVPAPARAEASPASDGASASRVASEEGPAAPVAAAPPPPEDAGPGDAGAGAVRVPEPERKWRSTQLAGTEELASRKGSWSYRRDSAESDADTASPGPAAPGPDPAVGEEPVRLDSPRDGGADDLKRISGVGPKLEEMLHGLGIYHFDQVAAWTDDEISWVDEHLEGFKGRVRRDEWVRQARDLAASRPT